jgi:uncharacterized membrane protein YphA (DoxX/SURF4 family)
MEITKKKVLSHLELAARIYAATMLLTYGFGKLMGGQFYQGSIPDSIAILPLEEVGGFDLAWTFFGYSYGYILFIGGTQILGSFLLLFHRTKILGGAILVPVLMNIIVVDFFFEISTGAMLSAISYFTAICFVLWYNRKPIIEAVQKVFINKDAPKPWKSRVIKLGIALVIVAMIVALENQMLNFVGR